MSFYYSVAKRAMLKTIHAFATQKTPKPPESEPHTVRLTFACRASKPCPSLTTAALGQKESLKKSWPVKKVGVAYPANRPIARTSTLFFRLVKCPRAPSATTLQLGYGPVVQTRSRGPPSRIPSWQVGYGWGLGVPGRVKEARPMSGRRIGVRSKTFLIHLVVLERIPCPGTSCTIDM